MIQYATTKGYVKPINSNGHLGQFLSVSKYMCNRIKKLKREDFRQLGLFLTCLNARSERHVLAEVAGYKSCFALTLI